MKLMLLSLLIHARRTKRTGPHVVTRVKNRKVFCQCGEMILKDGENQWIQRLMGMDQQVDGVMLQCGYTMIDIHSTDLAKTVEKRKYKRKCVSKTGYCYSMEMKRKDGTHTCKLSYTDVVENFMLVTFTYRLYDIACNLVTNITDVT